MVTSLCRQSSTGIRRFYSDMLKLSQERKVATYLMKNPQNILPYFFFLSESQKNKLILRWKLRL